MNPNPEQHLQRFRLPDPAPEFRTRVLAAARQEWSQPVPSSAGWTFRRPLLAVAASLVLLAAGNWANQRLTVSDADASAPPAGISGPDEWDFAGLPKPLPDSFQTIGPVMTAASLQEYQDQLRMLTDDPSPVAAVPPNGQSRLRRQITPFPASCC